MSARRPFAPRGLSRWLYYLSSIPTILFGVRERLAVVALFLGLPVSRPLLVTLPDGLRLKVRSRMDVWTVKESCLDREYERGFARVEDGWIVIDIGAALGDFAVRIARACPKARVLAFEPLPESFALMRENAALNGVTNLSAFAEAVSAAPGRLRLYTVTGLTGQHRTAGGGDGALGGSIEVPAVTLDQIFEREGLSRCDLVKIDCEGAEFDILFSASEDTLRRIDRLAVEYHDGVTSRSHEELAAYLETRGFAVQLRQSPAYYGLGLLFASRPGAKLPMLGGADSGATR